jgi:hypothetical protein
MRENGEKMRSEIKESEMRRAGQSEENSEDEK